MSEPLSFETVLEEELQQIQRLRERRGVRAEVKVEPPSEEEAQAAKQRQLGPVPTATARAHREQLVGLAFSGGGIRSATFNLGILQMLAKLGLLRHFDYLSTVSGGGYIGGWLTAWLHHCGLAEVTRGLQREHRENPSKSDPSVPPPPAAKVEPISFLRRYSNYLTPQTGFFSLDTWMAGATYVRNLVLNLNVLVFTLAAVLLLPRAFVALLFWLQKQPSAWWNSSNLLLAGVAVLAVVAARAVAIKLEIAWTAEVPAMSDPRGVLMTVVLPVFSIALLLVYWTFGELSGGGYWLWARAGGIGFLAFWTLTALFWWGFWIRRGLRRSQKGLKELVLWLAALVSAFVAGAGASWLLWLLLAARAPELSPARWLRITAWAPPTVVLAFIFAGIYFVGLMGRDLPEEERQWWSRLGAWLAMLAAAWWGLFLIAFYAPPALRWLGLKAPELIAPVGLGWVLATALGVIAGRGRMEEGKASRRWLTFGIEVAPFIFVLGLLMLLSLVIDELLPRLQSRDGFPRLHELDLDAGWLDGLASFLGDELDWSAGWLYGQLDAAGLVAAPAVDRLLPLLGLMIVLGVFALLLSWRIDVNEFSMHNFYRDRLTRAYLGASRERQPNRFSGFDRNDDIDLSTILDEGKFAGPYPILNATLNLTSGRSELAWQERKACSFVFTPRHHGFERGWATAGSQGSGAYRESAYLEPGTRPHKIALGTAMTVSGAAANPSMGYRSSPALAFLLTVFNVRLGLWMGNPAHPTAWRAKSPTLSLSALLNELLGITNADSKWINLADGGFFDNLGVYELVRRRCRFILACDAEADPGLEFSGLGNAIRRCRSDFGIDIRFENLEPLKRLADSPFSRWHCAVGNIHYDHVDERAPKGILVYVKATLTGDEPVDVLNYRRQHETFPHESTADQWFDESQFESYRRLGEHIAEVMLSAMEPGESGE